VASIDGRSAAARAVGDSASAARQNIPMTDPEFPPEASAADAQAAIADEFAYFGDWSERYQYLIDLGRKLPPLPAELRIEEHRLLGCQSMVWIVARGDAQRLEFLAASDSAIVSGLIYLALRVYSGRSAQEILATPADYIASIGLAKHLSPTRSNGLAALLEFIQARARAALA
jgi:cysteine desulfuration protein SufE